MNIDKEELKQIAKDYHFGNVKKVYVVYDGFDDLIRLVCKTKKEAMSRISIGAQYGDYIDEYKIIEVDLDKTTNDFKRIY